jgi:hypothetical protein
LTDRFIGQAARSRKFAPASSAARRRKAGRTRNNNPVQLFLPAFIRVDPRDQWQKSS